ncbi:hypothetical protein ACRRTK_016729 [Alexandromys fortis]
MSRPAHGPAPVDSALGPPLLAPPHPSTPRPQAPLLVALPPRLLPRFAFLSCALRIFGGPQRNASPLFTTLGYQTTQRSAGTPPKDPAQPGHAQTPEPFL